MLSLADDDGHDRWDFEEWPGVLTDVCSGGGEERE
jgi:hypothetical protein